jgi:YebC/PmpR family DNA-binding regulatory protein
MAGHSKWNNIKNRKSAVDNQRARIFNQLAKQIRISVKEGKSGDPKFNPSLRMLLDKARAANMPKEKVQKAIDVGLGKSATGVIQEIVYEGFGPGGIGILAVAHTDNPNRTSSEIKFIFSRNGGALGGPGSAMYLFKREGEDYQVVMPIPADDQAKDDVEEVYHAAEGQEPTAEVTV